MQRITIPGKYTGKLKLAEIVESNSGKKAIRLVFECADQAGEVWETEGTFWPMKKDGTENTTATNQLKNAGWNPANRQIVVDGALDENALWELIDAMPAVYGKECEITCQNETYKEVTSVKVAFVEGPHRGNGSGSGLKKASRPGAVSADSVPF